MHLRKKTIVFPQYNVAAVQRHCWHKDHRRRPPTLFRLRTSTVRESSCLWPCL